jgi:hypothetical protein
MLDAIRYSTIYGQSFVQVECQCLLDAFSVLIFFVGSDLLTLQEFGSETITTGTWLESSWYVALGLLPSHNGSPLDPSSSTPQDLCILPEQLQLNAMSLNDSKWMILILTDSGKDLHILHSTQIILREYSKLIKL